MPTWVLAFLAVDIPMIVIPGPDFAVITKNGFLGGRRLAIPTAIGAATGLVIWGALATAGIAAVLAASTVAYDTVKFAGAAYLAALGVLALRKSRGAAVEVAPLRGTTPRRAFLQGFLNDLFNPKSAVLYAALIPQFVPGRHPAVRDLILLAAINNVLALGWFLLVGLFVGLVRDRIVKSRARVWIEKLTGVVLIGLGVRIAAEHR